MQQNRVILIQPPSPRVDFTLPLGLAYIGSVLKQKKARVSILDATAPYVKYDIKSFKQSIKDYSPIFVGMSITTLFSGFAYDLIKELKEIKTTIVSGGAHSTLFPQEVITHGADIAVRNEGERAVEQLMDYFQGKAGLEDIPGISYRNSSGDIVHNPPRQMISDLDGIPFPAKELFNFKDYVADRSDLRRYGGIITSRGCFGQCSYCSKEVFGNKLRVRSADNILEELKIMHKKYGLVDFSFYDDVFTANKSRVFELCEKIERDLDFRPSWNCVSRVDCIDSELLKAMRRAGCATINYGVESANPATLKQIKKGVSIEKIEDIIFKTEQAGIECTINFMWGYPWETEQDLENTTKFISKIRPHVKEIMPGGVLIPFPGTEIYQQHKEQYGFDHWWLQRARFTGNYRIRTSTPLFRHFLFDDQGQFDGGGFFNLPKKLLKKIEKSSRVIDRLNMMYRHHPFVAFGILAICSLSRFIYKISPAGETFFAKIVFWAIRIKNRLLRERVKAR
ncbi:MAG: radical SAM protein [Candidatus Omnitrophica bacterium]|nr:radical SAM protein [Candidatus Omnitrophota bacterium]